MQGSARRHGRVDRGSVIIATVLLIGIVVLAHGSLTGSRPTFWAGLFFTIAGVLIGVVRLLTPRRE